MNTFAVMLILLVLLWAGIYTTSYGIWTFRDRNRKGGIALIILALACIAFPLYLLWLRR